VLGQLLQATASLSDPIMAVNPGSTLPGGFMSWGPLSPGDCGPWIRLFQAHKTPSPPTCIAVGTRSGNSTAQESTTPPGRGANRQVRAGFTRKFEHRTHTVPPAPLWAILNNRRVSGIRGGAIGCQPNVPGHQGGSGEAEAAGRALGKSRGDFVARTPARTNRIIRVGEFRKTAKTYYK